jgi:hypothetical protein
MGGGSGNNLGPIPVDGRFSEVIFQYANRRERQTKNVNGRGVER